MQFFACPGLQRSRSTQACVMYHPCNEDPTTLMRALYSKFSELRSPKHIGCSYINPFDSTLVTSIRKSFHTIVKIDLNGVETPVLFVMLCFITNRCKSIHAFNFHSDLLVYRAKLITPKRAAEFCAYIAENQGMEIINLFLDKNHVFD